MIRKRAILSTCYNDVKCVTAGLQGGSNIVDGIEGGSAGIYHELYPEQSQVCIILLLIFKMEELLKRGTLQLSRDLVMVYLRCIFMVERYFLLDCCIRLLLK